MGRRCFRALERVSGAWSERRLRIAAMTRGMSSGEMSKIAWATSRVTSWVACQMPEASWVENGLCRDSQAVSGGREIAGVIEDASR